jgi:multidrug efflux pump subunit AcrA (membrane-fusion protein)
VAVLEAAIRGDQAAIENARINLNYTTIRAPIAGRTGAVNLKRGNVVKSNDTTQQAVPLVTITQLRPIYVSFTEPEKHLTRIRTATRTDRLRRPGGRGVILVPTATASATLTSPAVTPRQRLRLLANTLSEKLRHRAQCPILQRDYANWTAGA